MNGSVATLEPRTVGSIRGEFWIPAYQRGYRWGAHEVRQLLDDILGASGEDYYLQPVVVKAIGADRWELVDGQQRLTTLYLILRALQPYLPKVAPKYRLRYETREDSETFLDDPSAGGEHENIDFFHIAAAARSIEEWLEAKPDATTAASELNVALNQSVHIIWYEAPDTDAFDSRTLFRRLNMGQIRLTDAELVKARLLSRVDRQLETAAEWDSIERDLRSPEVWAFATGEPDGSPTRIELLLDTLADEVAGPPQSSVRPLFQTFETLRPLIEEDPERLWERVVDLHSLILGWFDDRDLFHKIGYLISSGRATFGRLVTAAGGRTRSDLHAWLDAEIRASINVSASQLGALTYGSATKVSKILLLMNSETVRRNINSVDRYSFDAHARRLWSLEHIHAQNSEGLNTVAQWTDWLEEHRQALDSLALPDGELSDLRVRIGELIPVVTAETFQSLHHEITQLFSVVGESVDPDDPGSVEHSEVDSIANLALLAKSDNSQLSNSVFEVKRRAIIELDRAGTYIPVCTRNVFLKYYTPSAAQVHYWGPRDRDGYIAAMRQVLAPYLLPDSDPAESASEEEDNE